ncbi:DUF3667 domain-containing protein [Membranicola marinus]|uniref:DUF3667 domain-containing protein n=1 Tax=Membranihabitans marinus TaxID=1227546 RepID=A0A953HQ92_9BACT|nr:DUF3667 domain-containing protein [Membranihabitans marinus]MBY5959254.1 DUF3667 domain-containing protein [Membranihabitans marinus]
MDSNITTCQNCNRQLQEDFIYCPNCGQQTDEELSLRVLFKATIQNYFSIDARFFRSIGPLLFRPGFLPQVFVAGKRRMYLHPARMFLFLTFVFFFLFSFFIRDSRGVLDEKVRKEFSFEKGMVEVPSDSTHGDDVVSVDEVSIPRSKTRELEAIIEGDTHHIVVPNSAYSVDSSIPGIVINSAKVDSLIAADASDEEILRAMGLTEDSGYFVRKIYAQLLKLYRTHEVGAIYQRFFDTIPVAMFFLLPLFALLLLGFYYREGRYVHHLVFSFYYFSFVYVIFGLLYSFNRWLNVLPEWLTWILSILPLVYLLVGVKRFYRQRWSKSVIKSLAIILIFTLIITPITAGLVGLYAFLFY